MERLSLNGYSGPVQDQLHGSWVVGVGLCVWGTPAQALQSGRLLALTLHTPAGPEPIAAWALSADEVLRLPARLRGASLSMAPDIRALLNVTWLVLRQLSTGQLLPTLTQSGTRWQARWAVQGWDVDALTAALPGACVSATVQGAPPPPDAVVRDLLLVLSDTAARSALATAGPPLKARKPQAAGRWIMALHDKRPVVVSDEAKLQKLSAALQAWTPPEPPQRLTLTLHTPDGDGPWRLGLGLSDSTGQHRDAAAIWAGASWQLKETLLIEIARAATQFPALEDLRGDAPTGLPLTAEAAERFLVDTADTLAESGVVVRRPPLWDDAKSVRVQLRSHIGVDGLLAFDWAAALGGEVISEAELTRLASQKSVLVKHRGTWIRVDPDEVAQAAADVASEGMDALRRAAASPLGALGDDTLQALFSGQRPPPRPAPERFAGTLRPYQAAGLGWLDRLAALGLGACLADDMGLGKTVQVLAHLCDAPGKTLLVCPLSVLVNWQREAARFTPHLRVSLHHGPRRPRDAALVASMAEVDVLVTTYAVARSDAEALGGIGWSRIVLDEAQHIKNPDTATSRAIRGLAARHRIAMTGTPVENRLEELWAIMDFLSPGLLGSRASFKARYADPIEKKGEPLIAATLRRLVGPFLLRRRKTDPDVATDLPAKQEIKEPCRLTVEQAALYQAQLAEIRGRLRETEDDDGARRTAILAALTRLKQICNHPAQYLHEDAPLAKRSGKLARLEELIEAILASEEQVLIFTQYTAAARLICDRLLQRFRVDPLYLHGGLSRAQRQELIDRFQAGEAAVFVLSLKAAGTGLTLTAASHVIHYDRWWNPAVEDQATDRAWRLGQTRQVQVRKLICAGTIEERIDELIESKRALAAEVINLKGPGGLSTAELSRLVEG